MTMMRGTEIYRQTPQSIDWFRSAVVCLLGTVFLTLTVAWPALVALALAQPAYRFAGTALVVVPITLIAWSTALTRSSVAGVLTEFVTPSDAQLTQIHQHERASGAQAGTYLLTGQPISRPWVFQGMRWTVTVATENQYDDPALIVEAMRDARRRGIDRAVLMISAITQVYRAWTSAMRSTSSTVRPGYRTVNARLLLAGTLPLLPICAVGWALSWIVIQILRNVAPAAASTALLELGHTAQMVPRGGEDDIVDIAWTTRRTGFGRHLAHAVTAPTPIRSPLHRTGLRTPEALRRSGSISVSAALTQVVAGTILIGLGAYAGWGVWPAQRIIWPWESAPESAQVIAVESDEAGKGSLLDHLGLDIATAYVPEVVTVAGETLTLQGGTTSIQIGDTVHVVRSESSVRWLEQDRFARAAVIGSICLALTCLVQYASFGRDRISAMRKIKQINYDQCVLTGRRHRRRRPRPLFRQDR